MRSLAWGTTLSCVVCALIACGSRTDLGETASLSEGGSSDVALKKDVGVDVGPPIYQPQGKKCVRDADASAPLAFTPPDGGAPAIHPPQVVSSGGPVLGLPTFIPITFEGDELRDQIEDFIASVGCTTYWRTIANDYGVGDAITGTPVHLTEAAPTTIDDSAIGTWLRNKILSKAVPDAVQDQTLYVIYYPDTTTVTLQGDQSCHGFGGYHSQFEMNDGRKIPYAVLPRCQSFQGLGDIEQLTSYSSHELLEAVSDPEPLLDPAYQLPEPNGIGWALAGGGEIGDMCEFNDDAFFLPGDYAFYVQHSWTNHAAFLANNPCQPNDTYIAAAPASLPDTVPFDFGFGSQTTQGLMIALGKNRTIPITLIATQAWASPINVDVVDLAQFFGSQPTLHFSLSPNGGNVGDTLQLTITRVGTNSNFGMEPFVLRAQSAGQSSSWWVVVGNP